MTAARPVIIVAVHDGFYGCGTGAGRSNRAFLRVLSGILTPDVQLVILPVTLAPGSPEYDAAWHVESIAIAHSTGATVIGIDNGTSGQTRFGGLAHFRRASASAAAEITRLAGRAPRALTVAFDAPFFGLGPLLPARHAAATVSVARATAALHAPADQERTAWERAGLLATVQAGGQVAATSRHIRQHLTSAYGIPQAAIRDLVNGLTQAEARPGPGPRDTGLLPPAASRGFLLSYGRAEPYKGFDDLLDALAILKAGGALVPHTILGAVTEGPLLTAYQRHLAGRITVQELDVTLHTSFSPGFCTLLAHPGLAAVIVPSRTEPFGRIPLEAYAAGATPVIATTAGGLAQIVTEGRTGYTAAPADPRSLASAITRALAASPAQRQQLLTQGRQLTRTRYDYHANVRAFLAGIAPWALRTGQST
jgi:glycosyltransferase involved in cell wall biosynthesis